MPRRSHSAAFARAPSSSSYKREQPCEIANGSLSPLGTAFLYDAASTPVGRKVAPANHAHITPFTETGHGVLMANCGLAPVSTAGRFKVRDAPQATPPPPLALGLDRRDSGYSEASLVPLQPGDLGRYGGSGGTGKLPLPFNNEFFDLSSYGAPALPLPLPRPLSSGGSAAAYSPSESTASGTTLSTVPLDFASELVSPVDGISSLSTSSSRGPSPLCKVLSSEVVGPETKGGGGEYVCLVPRCESMFSRVEDLELHARTAHRHVCLWGDEGPCESAGFATREELNWHVKKEHLLVCPVLGCKETAFQSKELVDCHLRWAHGGMTKAVGDGGESAPGSSALLPASSEPPRPEAASPKQGAEATPLKRKAESPADRVLKMEMSIGISKKRCEDQLRAVLEKRSRRMKGRFQRSTSYVRMRTNRLEGAPLQAGDRPTALSNHLPRSAETISFSVIWEHCVLPFLIEFIPKWCGPGHVISVMRGRKPKMRRICIMTRRAVSTARRITIAGHVRDLLPFMYHDVVSFVFSTGEVDRLMVWARGLARDMPDEVCQPRNPFCYLSPCMGDSIGVTLEDGDEITATLGPCLTIAGGSYWLANFHPFVEAVQGATEGVTIEHPSPDDRSRCLDERHDALSSDASDFELGTLTATSGYDLKTTRVSHDPYWEECDKEPPLVVTDWTLISAQTRQANLLRKFPSTMQRKETPVTAMSPVTPGAMVCSTGRTSGHQRGQICEIPAYVHGTKAGNGTGKATREWFIEEPESGDDDEDAWIRGGIGVQGDSGAAVVDSETNALVGQVWGRNKYFGPGPRTTFFTPILDVIDDIQEKCGEQTRPQLPQHRDEADRWPAYPVCRRCFDMREYLDSRRSSRESLMSMIGLTGVGDQHDQDLTSSISELATPKGPVGTPRGDSSYLVRHAGPDEPGTSFGINVFSPASFNSAVSPTPVHTFVPAFQPKSPMVGEVRSPYAQTIEEEDLRDQRATHRSEVALGKRPLMSEPLVCKGSQHWGKRPRVS
ncbi:hypothetical protein DL766_001636 [Monosporascus sp. MC13-8B]|uniref:C2H2-type domain-containing protein n=1 Tax=Monosporascus cannonballus TaxID=155416 RepID=A0ABY0GV59_9PEZI|nr:hypothetical protein DL762_008804 [Monosporascus cannonballus]RYO81127.1 hypothetical protein DL763_008672 [Monosporascus cannonballus]RYP37167.1 hypothetical protein DL766_001636 [Monosporascus sp. MC13-8B]